jgi:hypothetical protein
MKKNNPLIENAIKRNENALIHLDKDSPQYQECKNKIDHHRHESIMVMLNEISKPKKIEIFIALVAFLALIVAVLSCFQPDKDVSQRNDTSSYNDQGSSRYEKTKESASQELDKSQQNKSSEKSSGDLHSSIPTSEIPPTEEINKKDKYNHTTAPDGEKRGGLAGQQGGAAGE